MTDYELEELRDIALKHIETAVDKAVRELNGL